MYDNTDWEVGDRIRALRDMATPNGKDQLEKGFLYRIDAFDEAGQVILNTDVIRWQGWSREYFEWVGSAEDFEEEEMTEKPYVDERTFKPGDWVVRTNVRTADDHAPGMRATLIELTQLGNISVWLVLREDGQQEEWPTNAFARYVIDADVEPAVTEHQYKPGQRVRRTEAISDWIPADSEAVLKGMVGLLQGSATSIGQWLVTWHDTDGNVHEDVWSQDFFEPIDSEVPQELDGRLVRSLRDGRVLPFLRFENNTVIVDAGDGFEDTWIMWVWAEPEVVERLKVVKEVDGSINRATCVNCGRAIDSGNGWGWKHSETSAAQCTLFATVGVEADTSSEPGEPVPLKEEEPEFEKRLTYACEKGTHVCTGQCTTSDDTTRPCSCSCHGSVDPVPAKTLSEKLDADSSGRLDADHAFELFCEHFESKREEIAEFLYQHGGRMGTGYAGADRLRSILLGADK